MKRVIFIVFFIFLCNVSFAQLQPCDSLSKKETSNTQNYLMPDINVVGFGGAWGKHRNMNNNGSFNGVYGDIGLTKQESPVPIYSAWQLAMFGCVSWSRFQDNLSYYSASSRELGGGLAFGYYTESTFRPIFMGISLGLIYSTDEGETIRPTGVYSREQNDWILALGLNIQLISRDKWFSRTQLDVKWETPLMTSATSSWQKLVIPASVWDREYIDVSLRQSVLDVSYSSRIVIVPKLMLRYSHSVGNNQNSYGIGVELGLKRVGQDEVFSCHYIFDITKEMSIIGAKLNFALL